mgnify:CR=1 FL=1
MLNGFWSSWRAWLLSLSLWAIHSLFDECFWHNIILLDWIWTWRRTWHILLHPLQSLTDEHTAVVAHYQLNPLVLLHLVFVSLVFTTRWLLFSMFFSLIMAILKIFLFNHLISRNLVFLNILLPNCLSLHSLYLSIFPMSSLCFLSCQSL